MNVNDPVETYPITRFAAVAGVEFAGTNDQHPNVDFRPGGVMLSEVLPGEFAIIITAQPCSRSIVAVTIMHAYQIVSDTERLQVRWSSGTRRFLRGPDWLYLHFADRLVFTDFMRAFSAILWEVQLKISLLQERIEHIAFGNPSNFANYCRQYLGEDYFDNVEDSDNDEAVVEGSQVGGEGDAQDGDSTQTASGDEGSLLVFGDSGSNESTIVE